MQAGIFCESTLRVTIGGVSVYKNSVAVVENNHVWQPLKHTSTLLYIVLTLYLSSYWLRSENSWSGTMIENKS